MSDEVMWLDAVAQAELVQTGTVTPIELVDAAIARIASENAGLNAVIGTRFELAQREALAVNRDLPFAGVPTLLKDTGGELRGEPIHYGMRALRDAGWTARRDSNVTAKLRTAGFIAMGRTNTPELANQATTEPFAYGPTANPWDRSRTAGGSSGGAAAAVAAGMVAAAHGNDGGGSIRIPASVCGLVGLKPSRGRVSLGPDIGEMPGGIATQGMLCRSVRDAAALLDVIAGPMPGDPSPLPLPARPFAGEPGAHAGRLRVGVLTEPLDGLPPTDPECVAAVDAVVAVLEAAGHAIEDDRPRFPAADTVLDDLVDLWAIETGFQMEAFGQVVGRPLTPDDVEPTNWALYEHAKGISALTMVAAANRRGTMTRRLAEWWHAGHDLLLHPTLQMPPLRLGEVVPATPDPLDGWRQQLTWICFTPIWNVTGQPAISLPVAESAGGLPIGVQLVAAHGREDLLLRVAAQIEEALPWAHRRPPRS